VITATIIIGYLVGTFFVCCAAYVLGKFRGEREEMLRNSIRKLPKIVDMSKGESLPTVELNIPMPPVKPTKGKRPECCKK
jgi:hypothetical protein